MKKIDLDYPDCFANYWHPASREEQIYTKRKGEKGSVMVWGRFVTRRSFIRQSPDLNPIGNSKCILARGVHADRRQFIDVRELVAVFKDEWNRIPEDFLRNLSRCRIAFSCAL